MQVIHPQGALIHGVPPENTFIAVDDMGAQVGCGYIIYQYQEHLYPECPINMYFSLESEPAGRYVIFGALIARARQLRDQNPQVRACAYTAIQPGNTELRDFYDHNGLNCQETENLYRLTMNPTQFLLPMSFIVQQAPLRSMDEQRAFLNRMMDQDIAYIDLNYLGQLSRMPNFQAIGVFNGAEFVGEALMAGTGERCELQALYIAPKYRRQGLGKALVSRCMLMMGDRGVTEFTARFVSRSDPQMGLARAFQAADLGVETVYPCLYL